MKKIITFLICFNIIFLPAYSAIINDDFVENTLDKNLKIKKYQYYPIVDDFAACNKNSNPLKKAVSFDEITPRMPEHRFVRKPVVFDDNYKEVKIRIKDFYTTKSNFQEGEEIEFLTLDDVQIRNKNFPKNSIVKARLETISKNKSFGVPSDVVIGNFMLDNIPLSGEISKTGANRSLWLYPVVYNTVWFFGAGLLLIPIRGGHAKIKPSQIFTLYVIE